MRLDPPGFTGPSTPCDRNDVCDGNLDRCYSLSFSSSNLALDFVSRRITTARVSSFRRRRLVDVLPSARHPEIFEQPQRSTSEEGRRRICSYDRDDFPGATPGGDHRRFASWLHRRSAERERGFKTRNATAFHASNCSFCRSGVRARIRMLANISGKRRRTLRFRCCSNGDRWARQENGRIDVSTTRNKDSGDGRFDDVDNVDSVDERSPSVSRVSRSRPFQHSGTRKPRTRWKKKDHRDRTIFQESLDFSRIPNANATNVPPADAFAYTAYNDENENEVEDANADADEDEDEDADEDEGEGEDEGEDEDEDENKYENENGNENENENENEIYVGDSRTFRAIRNVSYPKVETELCRQIYDHTGKVDVEGSETNTVCGKGRPFEKLLGYRCRDTWQRDTREKLRVGKCESRYYTARFQEPITNESCEYETELSTHGPTKVSNSCGRKYRLLFILYLLAWPVVCSTNPSGLFPSSFTNNPSLGPVENLSQHNSTQISSLLPSATAHQPTQQQKRNNYQHLDETHDTREQLVRDAEYIRDGNGHHRRRHEEQQGEQGREQREVEKSTDRVPNFEAVHPYNEYSWEVNQINPWLSACDLAGPAPADLQGSCGPPEVPKTCPVPCVAYTKGKGNDAEFDEVIEMVEQTGRTDRNYHRASVDKDATDDKDKADRGISAGVQMAPEQCLFYLEESHKEDICRDDFGRTSTRSFLTPRENRYWFMSGLRLRHCCEHAVVNALAPGKGGPLEDVLNGGQKCIDALDKLLLVDALAARLHCEFEEVLVRYDCAQSYSVIFNCTHCKEAYRRWVCSSLVPYFAHGGPQDLVTLDSWVGSRLRPCRSFCQAVEQRCPYLLPGDRAPSYPTQYAGEPTFLCRDPNIPETGEQAARALHSNEEDECCFQMCSEETLGSGICVNCTNRDARKHGRIHDPPTAPHCEISPIQPASTGGIYPEAGSTESSTEEGERYDSSTDSSVASMTSMTRQRGASLCGSGGVGSMTSVSSSGRSSASILPQLFWLCTILSSTLANVRTIPVLWVSRIFLWSMVPFGGNSDVAGECDGGAGGSGSKRTIHSVGLVAWLRRCFGRSSYVRIRYGAMWLLEKWIAVEHRFRSWWCCCWYWWWWRWRRVPANGLARWKFRPRRQNGNSRFHRQFVATRHLISVSFMPIASIAAHVKDQIVPRSRGTLCGSLHEYSSARTKRSTQNFFVGYGSSVKCPWRRWSWWCWWLYRWWRSRWTCYGGSINDRTGDKRNRLCVFLHGSVNMSGRKRRKRRRTRRGRRMARRAERSRKPFDTFQDDVECSPVTPRYVKVSSLKDPP